MKAWQDAGWRHGRGLVGITVALCLAAIGAPVAHALESPDPGGNETAAVPVPPGDGKYFGFNDQASLSRGVRADALAFLTNRAGANIHRVSLNWQEVEPERDVSVEISWDRYEQVAEAFRNAGQPLLITLSGSPVWARDPGGPRLCSGILKCKYPPARSMLNEWSEFVAEVARRFPDAIIETWNEPNIDSFWRPGPQPARWAELHAVTHSAVKSVNPAMPVIAGGIAGSISASDETMPAGTFLERAYSTGHLTGRAGYLGIHLFTENDRSMKAGTIFARTLHDVRGARNRGGGKGTELFITETGLSTSGDWALTPEQQADGLIRRYRRLMTMPDVAGVIFHTAIDQAERPPSDRAFGFGVARSAAPLTPKPAYCEFAGRAFKHPAGGCKRIVDVAADDDGIVERPPASERVLRSAKRRCRAWEKPRRAFRRAKKGKRKRLVERCVSRFILVRERDKRLLKRVVIKKPKRQCKRVIKRKARNLRARDRAYPPKRRTFQRKRCIGRRSLAALKSQQST